MNSFKEIFFTLIAYLFVVLILPLSLSAQEVPLLTSYMKGPHELAKHKNVLDDPKPYLKTWSDKAFCPPAVYKMISGDPAQMKTVWAEVVGFKAPDVVGKVHPEIKPGKYTYKDVQANPAFKELIWPELYNRIKPGGPPFAGNIPEFEIVPTKQYYWAGAIGETTKKNAGKTKLDSKGYVDFRTWEGGFPFPRPSGQFKAQQIAYNALTFRRDREEGNGMSYGHVLGFDRNLKKDMDNIYTSANVALAGRAWLPPYGWADGEAKSRGELAMMTLTMYTPRDIAGMAVLTTYYLDPNKADAAVMYVPSLRRVRKLSTTDTQDPIMGQDLIYDDQSGFLQKLSPTRYPYKYEVEEKEYLVPAPTIDGSEYVTSKGLELRNVKMERRPIYVLKMTQTDPNYVYSKRVFYVDRETFQFYFVENYDRKGRLYRTFYGPGQFKPDQGMFTWGGYLVYRDHVDLHSNIVLTASITGKYTRNDAVAGLTKGAK
ncbi:MAG: hypothetical protein A4E65_02717 [Syntrophorhabdus sp. PtaU1.Bin153]|nr:MAG: hypothetical protein A4E65_02717 [Syntrophorhabdus sp. PtaU1.Bin153]